ncbi:MAG: type II toxin-antitoxin system RelE/ParE family toxin [Gammaproteobacteria bacterium]|jgi:proteic killer suppression protein
MIISWKHKGLKLFFEEGITKGIQAKHSKILKTQLLLLNTASSAVDMNIPAFKLHMLKGKMKGLYAITVNANWRLTFGFKDKNVILVNYEDYH